MVILYIDLICYILLKNLLRKWCGVVFWNCDYKWRICEKNGQKERAKEWAKEWAKGTGKRNGQKALDKKAFEKLNFLASTII
jgi:hypothetical protein